MAGSRKKEAVILVHGLIRSRASMLIIGTYLKMKGYIPVYFPYHSTTRPICIHAAKLAQFTAKFAKNHPDTVLHFVTHSLGGIIAREALAMLEEKSLKAVKQFGRMVMTAPPNRGSARANILSENRILSEWIKPLDELRTPQNSYIHTVRTPKSLEIGIISGRFDGKVKPYEAELDEAVEHITINAMHTFIMNSPAARKAVLSFLKYGTFSKKSTRNTQ